MPNAQARGLSLWLMPEVETAECLAAWTQRLAARHGTERFAPHLTLVSALEQTEPQALRAARRAAAGIAPFAVSLGDIQGRDEHFRCLFVRAQDDGALRAAHATAARAFGREPDGGFLPHVSLVYGTLAPDEKRAIAQEVGDDLRLRLEVRRLHLWRTEGLVAEWRELAVFDLRGPAVSVGLRAGLEATVTSKGQITLPKPLRERLGLKTGSRIRFRLDSRGRLQGEPLLYDLEDLWAEADRTHRPRRTMTPQQMAAAKARRRW